METVVADGLWNSLVDPTQVENALLNLAINARDAMEGSGRLTIEAHNALLDEAYARQQTDLVAGQYVLLVVTDTGSGMSPEVLLRAFEPFYSTKPEGKGTGLGLSMVYGFIKQSGGHVKVFSEPGHGTTVKLYLPRSLDDEAPALSARSRTAPAAAKPFWWPKTTMACAPPWSSCCSNWVTPCCRHATPPARWPSWTPACTSTCCSPMW